MKNINLTTVILGAAKDHSRSFSLLSIIEVIKFKTMKKSQKQALAVGGGLAAIAAAAAGVYLLSDKQNRKKAAKWVKDMQKEVIDELNKAGKATKATYNKAVDTVTKNYEGLKNVSTTELALVAAELKERWDAISDEVSKAGNTVRSVVPKSVSGGSKKVKVNGKTTKASAKKATAKKSPAKKSSKK